MPEGDVPHRALELAVAEAAGSGSETVEPIHLLIGVLRLSDPEVSRVLAARGIDPVRLRRRLRGYARRVKTGRAPVHVARSTERILERSRRGRDAAGRPDPAVRLLEEILRAADGMVENSLAAESVDIASLLRAAVPAPGRGTPPAGRPSAPRRRRTARVDVVSLETALKQRVVGQDHAASTVARVVSPALSGPSRRGRPAAVLLLVGSGDVGRSSVARALASHVNGDGRRLVRLGSHSWIGEPKTVEALSGPGPAIIYVDDVEGLPPGRRSELVRALSGTDPVFPENAVVFVATRVGSEGGDVLSPSDVRARLSDELGAEFMRPFDRVVLFQQLTVDDIRTIAAQWLEGLVARANEEDGIGLSIEPGAVDALAEIGCRPGEGLCAMRRAVESAVVRPFRRAVESGAIARGATARILESPEGIVLEGLAGKSSRRRRS